MPDRITFLTETFREKVEALENGAFDKIVAADPTHNKPYCQWMLNLFLRKNLKTEDLYRAKDYLSLYHIHKSHIAAEKRDINKIKSLPDLFDIVEPFIAKEVVSNREADRRYEQGLIDRDEAEILINTEDFKIIVPKTKAASIWFGRGTQWCTAATDSDNAFENYNCMGPLYIIDAKKKGKFQLHIETQEIMDARDRPVDLPSLTSLCPGLGEHILKALPNLPYDLVEEIVESDLSAIKGIKDKSVLLDLIVTLPKSLMHLDNPSEELQMHMIEWDHIELICKLPNASRNALLRILKRNAEFFDGMVSKDEAVFAYALYNRPTLILSRLQSGSQLIKFAFKAAVHGTFHQHSSVEANLVARTQLALEAAPKDRVDEEIKQIINLIKHKLGPEERAFMEAAIPFEIIKRIALQRYPQFIRLVDKPTIAEQLLAVHYNGNFIQHISNPSERVCKAAIRKSAAAIQFISKPSLQVQLMAVQAEVTTIDLIVSPRPDVRKMAMESIFSDRIRIFQDARRDDVEISGSVRYRRAPIDPVKYFEFREKDLPKSIPPKEMNRYVMNRAKRILDVLQQSIGLS